MQAGDFSNKSAAAILDDCYHLALDFVKIHFEHSFYEANQVAHELARLDRSNNQLVWLDDSPSFLIPLLLKDVTYATNDKEVLSGSKNYRCGLN
jgi:hypothetical protein